jgi:phosphatidylglycerophosphatase A
VSFSRALASVLGVGYLPYAPGTWATLIALIPAYFLRALPTSAFLGVCALTGLLAVWTSDRAARERAEIDPSWIVIDEVVGLWVALSWVDRGDLRLLALGALLFRVFDILKPWPIRALERRVKGGLGIVLDDLAAGLLAAVCLAAFNRFG